MTTNKIILVTGATSGIGREAALLLARQGHRVLATGRNEERLQALTKDAGDLSLETFRLDVTDSKSIEEAVAEVDKRTEGYGLDVLVNNAGFGMAAPMETISDADLRAQFETNVFGLVAMTQKFVGAMRARGSGKVINVSSVVGRVSIALQGGYCATKFAVEALTDALRMELRGFGIRVVLVEPGAISTRFEESLNEGISRYGDGDTPYKQPIQKYAKMGESMYKKAPGPAPVAKTIAKIVRKKRPRPRYVTPGRNIAMIWGVKLLPTRWMDAGMGKALGLNRKSLKR